MNEHRISYTHVILKFYPQITFSPWAFQFCYSPWELLIPQPYQPFLLIFLVLSPLFPHFLFGYHVLHWTWISLQFIHQRISQVISPSLWRVSHLIQFLRIYINLTEGWAQVAPIRLRKLVGNQGKALEFHAFSRPDPSDFPIEALSGHVIGNIGSQFLPA